MNMGMQLVGSTMLGQLEKAIAAFDGDPADSDYQRGYLAALVEQKKELLDIFRRYRNA